MSFTVVISRVVLEESNEGSFADSFSLNEEQSLAQAECCFCTLTTGICVYTKKKNITTEAPCSLKGHSFYASGLLVVLSAR